MARLSTSDKRCGDYMRSRSGLRRSRIVVAAVLIGGRIGVLAGPVWSPMPPETRGITSVTHRAVNDRRAIGKTLALTESLLRCRFHALASPYV